MQNTKNAELGIRQGAMVDSMFSKYILARYEAFVTDPTKLRSDNVVLE